MRQNALKLNPLSLGFIAFLCIGLPLAAEAQSAAATTLDAPISVCAGDEFEVEWTGPDGPGDLVAVSLPDASPNDFINSQISGDGSPAILRAPAAPATYEVRYVQNEPLAVLQARDLLVTSCTVTSGTSASGSSGAGTNMAVLVTGIQAEYAEEIDMQGYSRAELCSAGDAYANALGQIVDQIEVSMVQAGAPITISAIESMPGAPNRADIANDLRNAREEFCDRDDSPKVYPFAITYASCRMAMITPSNAMDIHLPPGIGTGMMSMADHSTREVVQLSLRRNIDAVSEFVGDGWSNMIEMNATGATGQRIGYATREFEFEYTAGLGGGAAGGLQSLAGLVSVTNTGSAWVSKNVPGIDIVRSFYENLTREVQMEQGATSFFSGLISNLVGMLREGIPLQIEQTVSSKVMGRTQVSGKSEAIITGIRLVEFRPAWCSESLMPADYSLTDIDQQVAEAMSGAGNNAPSSAELGDAMRQFEQAMEQLTPEQRQMMEQMGLGGGLPGAAGAAPPAAATTTVGASAGGRSAASADDLMTDNLLQSVQNHLQALGYDAGNTDGETSVMTTVSISQFQAEKGMEVTGEATPQLLGVLSAEVAKRRGN